MQDNEKGKKKKEKRDFSACESMISNALDWVCFLILRICFLFMQSFSWSRDSVSPARRWTEMGFTEAFSDARQTPRPLANQVFSASAVTRGLQVAPKA